MIVEGDKLYFKARASHSRTLYYWAGWSLSSAGELTELIAATPETPRQSGPEASAEDDPAALVPSTHDPPVMAMCVPYRAARSY